MIVPAAALSPVKHNDRVRPDHSDSSSLGAAAAAAAVSDRVACGTSTAGLMTERNEANALFEGYMRLIVLLWADATPCSLVVSGHIITQGLREGVVRATGGAASCSAGHGNAVCLSCWPEPSCAGMETIKQHSTNLSLALLLPLLLLRLQVDEYVSSAEVRQQYPAVSPTVLLKALEKYKEVPGQAKKKPDWASKKAADAAVKQLKAQAAAAAAAVAAASSTVRLHDLGEMSPVKPALP